MTATSWPKQVEGVIKLVPLMLLCLTIADCVVTHMSFMFFFVCRRHVWCVLEIAEIRSLFGGETEGINPLFRFVSR